MDRFFGKLKNVDAFRALRVSVAFILLLQVFLVALSANDFFSTQSSMAWNLAHFYQRADRLSLLVFTRWFQLSESGEKIFISIAGSVYVLSLLGMMFGKATRASSIVAWLSHMLFLNSNTAIAYGVDEYARWILFYLMWVPSAKVRDGNSDDTRSVYSEILLRTIQIHLAITYLDSGLAKLKSPHWRSGAAVWYGLLQPQYHHENLVWIANHSSLTQVIAAFIILVEFGYAVFIWPKKTRFAWLLLVIFLHLGIMFFFGLFIFGLLMIAINVSLFGFGTQHNFKSMNEFHRSKPL